MAGKQGTTVLHGDSLEVCYADEQREVTADEREDPVSPADPMALPSRWHHALLHDAFISLEQRKQPMIDGWDALRSLQLIGAMECAPKASAWVK